MAQVYVFADESGNLDFSKKSGASRYFVLTTITAPSCEVGDALLRLRREMAWAGKNLNSEFHATSDEQATRDAVFATLTKFEFRVDATILEKDRVLPVYRKTAHQFYFHAWYEHFRTLAPEIVTRGDQLLVLSASLGTKQTRSLFFEAVSSPVSWLVPSVNHRTAHWSATSDPCLQAADYCCWAIQRKWETGDMRSYDLIASHIQSEQVATLSSAPPYY
jgi:hypothetical protein